MEPVKISVIIPVFNPGEGILKCLKCLQVQSLKEIEMIFIDDCGTDDAIEHVKKAAESDPRIKLLENPQNLGAGPSRNRGIEAAAGEYLSFIDPDDYISDNFLELLYQKAAETNSDIVKGVCMSIDENEDSIPADDPYQLNDKIRWGLENGRPLYELFTFQHTTAVYRRRMVISGQVRYAESSYSEDAVFLLKACFTAGSIEFADAAVYFYVARGRSSVRNFTVKRWEGEKEALEEMLRYIGEKRIDTPAGYSYAATRIRSLLDLQQYFDDREKVSGDDIKAASMLEELRGLILSQPYCSELVKADPTIDACINYKVNLSVLPYGWGWREIRYMEYKNRVDSWVSFLKEHPEYGSRSRICLWRVFENAIFYDGWKDQKKKKGALKYIRRQAHRLPDKKLLTENFISMRLFVDLGIDTFHLRKTKFGALVQYLAAKKRGCDR